MTTPFICEDCSGPLLPGQVKSRTFNAFLCISCWKKRTGWDKVLEAAANDAVSDADVEALAEQARQHTKGVEDEEEPTVI